MVTESAGPPGLARRSPTPRLFCFGLGYCAEALARAVLAEGWSVAGTVHHAPRLAALAATGIAAWRFDRANPLPAEALAGVTHILSSVPPDAGEPVLDLCEPAIRAAAPGWIGYLSTTGVYGDHRGGWVDETTPPRPTAPRTERRVAAEERWLALGAQVFRLAGIYGPGRNPLVEARAGRARRIVKPGQRFGRIHVEDVARVLRAAMARPRPGAIYNVADDEPAPHDEVVAFACDLLGLPPPPAIPVEQAELSPFARSVWADSKQVSNRRIKDELGVALAYPTYREGLRALAATV